MWGVCGICSDQVILKNRSGEVPVSPDLAVQAVVSREHMEGYPHSYQANVQSWHTTCRRSGSSLRSGGISVQSSCGLLFRQPIADLDVQQNPSGDGSLMHGFDLF